MFQNLILSARPTDKRLSAEKEMARLLASKNKVGSLTKLLHFTSALGLLALLILASMFFNPDLVDKFRQLSPFGEDSSISAGVRASEPDLAMLMATPELVSQNVDTNETAKNSSDSELGSKRLLGNQHQQQLVTNWLSKRYRVANEAIDMLVSAAYLTAKETKLDPLLILSVIAIESRFNPFSESPVGAQGLMQVMSKVHHDKFSDLGGIKAALNPVANIKVGAMILRDYVSSAGSIEAGLKRYVGAADNETDGGYGNLVMAEYKRLKDVAAGKSVSIFSTTAKPSMISRPQEVNTEKRGEEITQQSNNLIGQAGGI
ncbi:transglycosylase SLT domain-containing protein [Undibacterium fentianense]|uniref:Transglycosylase SLT domain-containing protein n=1 Tax=Undibacterium fentianense TaxID=2828728 RepID=A0A941DZB3_9BURK|nr:transglycosylase SLT domain-containing protein [Undibacterium fentianense]MBR7798397.1 transglycosylase SLT domain-containing protein [Undibacterium fentianense]